MNFKEIERNLLDIQKPGRYIGNEIGIPEKDFINSEVRVVVGYPDVYEVGMSNQGIKILYDRINKLEYASCERVFSPWIDFEKLLLEKNYPLFSLETKSPIKSFNIFGMSIQYELLFSNFLNFLKLSQIEIFSKKRNNDDPIILCGGPGIVNPVPYSNFVDLFYIGEAEEIINQVIEKYRSLKNQNKQKHEILKELSDLPGLYSPEYSKKKVTRQVYRNFHKDEGIDIYLIPNIDIVQNKIVVEIMRGCPNKCRFCQAGVIYKPSREKELDIILKSVEKGINKTGLNEVTFSSLSSGDYSQILILTEYFNKLYEDKNISFSLPSIRVESFDLELIEKLSLVRKSGLTFAIESGSTSGQSAINKIIAFDKIKEIIQYASQKGWRLVKLYFMIGLPGQDNEINNIINFLDNTLKINKKLKINLNIAVFVPKPHTPFQFEKQMPLEESINSFKFLKDYYHRSRVSVKYHNPYMTYLEGFIARGDEKAGNAMYEAFLNGARFDSWEECFNFSTYLDAFKNLNIDADKYLSYRDINEKMPWDIIDIGVGREFYANELKKCNESELTKGCKDGCDENCYICNNGVTKRISKKDILIEPVKKAKIQNKKTRYFIEFSKLDQMRFIGHKDLIRYFEKLLIRADVPVYNTEGFNPKPKMQFSKALQLGVESICEIVEIYLNEEFDSENLLKKLKKCEHKYISISRIKKINAAKKISFINELYYSTYNLTFNKLYTKELNTTFNNYNKTKFNYTFNKKGKEFSGVYNDYIEFTGIKNNLVNIIEYNKTSTPRILEALFDIFKIAPIQIKKQAIYSKKENIDIPLFNFFD